VASSWRAAKFAYAEEFGSQIVLESLPRALQTGVRLRQLFLFGVQRDELLAQALFGFDKACLARFRLAQLPDRLLQLARHLVNSAERILNVAD
jgi:hypothetical protein